MSSILLLKSNNKLWILFALFTYVWDTFEALFFDYICHSTKYTYLSKIPPENGWSNLYTFCVICVPFCSSNFQFCFFARPFPEICV